MPVVDVREVADAHLKAIKVAGAADKRFILSNRSAWFKEIAEMLKAEYGRSYKIKAGDLKYCTMKFASYFDASAKLVLPLWNKEF